MARPIRNGVVMCLVLLIGLAAGVLLDRYVLAHEITTPINSNRDVSEVAKKWLYPSGGPNPPTEYSQIDNSYFSIGSTSDSLAKVAAYYQGLVGAEIRIEGNGMSMEGGMIDRKATAVDTWEIGNPARKRHMVLAARTEEIYTVTVVLYRGDDDTTTHIALSFTGH